MRFIFLLRDREGGIQNTVTITVSRSRFPSPETGRKTEIENKVIFSTVALGFLDMNFY